MRVLLVRLTSMGDIVHAWPAITDAIAARSDLTIDWAVDAAFAALPGLHPGVSRVLPLPLRAVRGASSRAAAIGSLRRALVALRAHRYDRVVDVQGLIKSALVALLARGSGIGPAPGQARETLASRCYGSTIELPPALLSGHAIQRVRALLARALDYSVSPDSAVDYGLAESWRGDPASREVLLLHGTTWATKHWPETHWIELAERVRAGGFEPVTTWGDALERRRAQRLAERANVRVLARRPLDELAGYMTGFSGVVAADTGLAHLSAALGVPTVAVLGPTDPGRTGVIGARARNLASRYHCAPCLQRDCAERPQAAEPPGTTPGVSGNWPPCLAQVQPESAWMALLECMTYS